MALDIQFQNYIVDTCSNCAFLEVKGIGDFAGKMVETQKDAIYPIFYLLMKLVLTFPVMNATIEKSFFCNEIYKKWIMQSNERSMDCLVVYIERDVLVALIMKLLCNIYKI